jgi:hypothetical protein
VVAEAHIDDGDAQAWIVDAKLQVVNVSGDDLLEQIESEVLGRIGSTYDASVWTSAANTPTLVRKIIAMLYAAAIYNKTYSEDGELSPYAISLQAQAETLIDGIASGNITLPDSGQDAPTTSASFYPTNLSSSQRPTLSDPSLGPAKFSMGTIW